MKPATLQKPAKKTGRPKASESRLLERREEIKRLIENIGLWNIPHTELANKWGVHRKTIEEDIASITKGIAKEDLEDIRINISLAYRKAIKEMQRIMSTGDEKNKVAAARAFADVENRYNQMLEAHGIKAKIADKVEIDASAVIKKLLEVK
jgi:predicted regulator of amino acid metabolism with ACT domain